MRNDPDARITKQNLIVAMTATLNDVGNMHEQVGNLSREVEML